MSAPEVVPEVTVWTAGGAAPILTAVLEAMDGAVRVTAVGGERAGPVADLARRHDVPDVDDLRKLRVDYPAGYLLLGDPEVDPDDLLGAVSQGTTVLSLEPIAETLQDLAHLRGEAGKRRKAPETAAPANIAGHILTVPQFLACPGFRRASDPHEALGGGRVVAVHHTGRPDEGSLFARLYDAWLTVLSFTSLPETIDASLTGQAVPETLRELTGHVAAHGRLGDGGAVTLQVSSRAGDRQRWLSIIADHAQLRVEDTSYDLRQIDGSPIDHADPAAESPSYAQLVAEQWRRIIDRPRDPDIALQHERSSPALACCLTCLLSARTGQPESPRRVLEINR